MGSSSDLILIDNDLLAIGYGGDDQCARIGLLPTVLLIILVQGTKMQILQVSRLQRVLESAVGLATKLFQLGLLLDPNEFHRQGFLLKRSFFPVLLGDTDFDCQRHWSDR